MTYRVESIDELKTAAEIGEKYRGGEIDQITEMEILDEITYYEMSEWALRVAIASASHDISFEIRNWYRVGEPGINYRDKCYYPSFNYAERKPESGVSVISREWLDSSASTFYDLSTDVLRGRGIWEIPGFVIASGGDGEPLICPIDWAKRLRVYSRTALEKLIP